MIGFLSVDGDRCVVTPVPAPVSAWLSPAKAALELFGSDRKVGEQTVRSLIRNGSLRAGKLGSRWVISRAALEEFRVLVEREGFVSTRPQKSKRKRAQI